MNIKSKISGATEFVSDAADNHKGKILFGKWTTILGSILYLLISQFGDTSFKNMARQDLNEAKEFSTDAVKVTHDDWMKLQDSFCELRDAVKILEGKVSMLRAGIQDTNQTVNYPSDRGLKIPVKDRFSANTEFKLEPL